ncbi:hypothetical protein A6723_021960 [Pseudomonas sp. AU11447]|uniref:hypothetical protein n=1 Tax=unclassified Pseudomonas TaxID=196821 RepID=UPI0006D3E7B3|nr:MULTISPECIES: hypothetical protein [unclassified Pseudomonas]OBY90889.1 hypothetical protein A6723_021960 [Pseudomonas sp. AU11447]
MKHDSFRSLYYALIQHSGEGRYEELLKRSLEELHALMSTLEPLKRLNSSRPGTVDQEKLQELFALSVINEHLLCASDFSLSEYQQFFRALGFVPFDPPAQFNPALCEVMSVDNSTAEQSIALGHCHWPGLKFGELIFSRCAVDISCPQSLQIINGFADCSTLYFTNHRNHRPVHDLSHGWGNNSRWRTAFHRTYEIGNLTLYNVDGSIDLADPEAAETLKDLELQRLALVEAQELLIHRCQVGASRQMHDYFPYDWTMAIAGNPQWPLRPENIMSIEQALADSLVNEQPLAE